MALGGGGGFGLVCISGYVRETMHSTETSHRVHLTEDVVLDLLVVANFGWKVCAMCMGFDEWRQALIVAVNF